MILGLVVVLPVEIYVEFLFGNFVLLVLEQNNPMQKKQYVNPRQLCPQADHDFTGQEPQGKSIKGIAWSHKERKIEADGVTPQLALSYMGVS